MSLFFDSHYTLNAGEKATCSSWSNNDFNMLLAIATDRPRVVFVGEEGQIMPNYEVSRGKTTPAVVKWHPVF